MKKSVQSNLHYFFSDYPLSSFDKGQILLRPGEAVSQIYYIQKGRIKEYDISEKGEEVIVNDIESGMFFPESSVLDKIPNQYFFESTSDVELNVAPLENVIKYIKNDPHLAYELLKELSHETEDIRRRMAHLMGGNSYSRTLFELLSECQKFGIKQKNSSCKLNLHEEDIAQRSGLTRETVNRQLSKLKKMGILSVDHQNITIHNMKKLKLELSDKL